MQPADAAVTIRPVETVAEYRACQELQRRVWGISEDGYVVPVATMVSVQHAGGLVLGAFMPDAGAAGGERLAGFAFGYLGRIGGPAGGRWALYSQLAAVDASLRAAGLGGQLKQAQRSWARQQGLELVAWSFDPLQAGNAYFNLHRLGAFCRTYHVNYFGDRSDALNAGLDSDRLLAEWPVEDVATNWHGEEQAPLDLIQTAPSPACSWSETAAAAAVPLRIEIPAEIVELRQRDAPRARAWQQAVREAFQRAFAAGYIAMEVQRDDDDGVRRNWYLLRRDLTPGPSPTREGSLKREDV